VIGAGPRPDEYLVRYFALLPGCHVDQTNRPAFDAGLRPHGIGLIRFSHDASSSRKTYCGVGVEFRKWSMRASAKPMGVSAERERNSASATISLAKATSCNRRRCINSMTRAGTTHYLGAKWQVSAKIASPTRDSG
jgi:hypothetical protein